MRRMDRRLRAARRWPVAGAALLFGLGGCAGIAPSTAAPGPDAIPPARAGASAADASLVDRFVSWMGSGLCPAAEDGGCCEIAEKAGASAAPVTVVEAKLYCYRTLAAITCYEAPDPQASSNRLVR